MSDGIGKVFDGPRKASDGLGKVLYGLRKVSDGLKGMAFRKKMYVMSK